DRVRPRDLRAFSPGPPGTLRALQPRGARRIRHRSNGASRRARPRRPRTDLPARPQHGAKPARGSVRPQATSDNGCQPRRSRRRAHRARGHRRANRDHDRPPGLAAPRRRARRAAAAKEGLMATTAVDPITTEVIRNALNSAAEEMNATLFRSAYTWIIYELRDCSVALLDADHRVLGQSSGLPIFLGNLEVCTQLTEEMYGRQAWQRGDCWALNASYLAGTHLNDITVFSPIFHEDELIGFGASRAHWLDVGAKDPGSPMNSTDIWQEGIRMGPIKIAE